MPRKSSMTAEAWRKHLDRQKELYYQKPELERKFIRQTYRKKNRKEILERQSARWKKTLETETKEEKQARVKEKKEYDREYLQRVKNEPWYVARIKREREKYRGEGRKDWDTKYRKNNKKSIASSNKKWGKKKGKGYFAQIASKRRGIKANAVLPSTDFKKIEKMHRQCRKLSKETGIEHHVDHIIAMAIGGAHHQDNLRIITAEENLRKGDSYLSRLKGVWSDNELAKENKPLLS